MRTGAASAIAGLDRSLVLALFPDPDEPSAVPRVTGCSTDDLLDLVEATARAESRLAGIRAHALAELCRHVQHDCEQVGAAAGSRHDLDQVKLIGRLTSGMVAHALGSSLAVADRELTRAARLERHPELARVLAAGEVDVRQTEVILDAAAGLEPAEADALVTSMLATTDVLAEDPAMAAVTPVRELASGRARLWDLVPRRLGQVCRREAARLDPTAMARRHRVARGGRRAALVDLPDAMADLHLIGPADQLGAAWANLDETARQARRAGDGRNLDSLRHDIAVGWLSEGASGTLVTRPAASPEAPPAGAGAGARAGGAGAQAGGAGARTVCLPPPMVHINVTVAATTLLGLDSEPGYLHGPTGPVPIPAGLAREIAHDPQASRWRRLLYDPATGIATDLSTSYRPPPRMADFVRARDGWQTRNPMSCATRLELDHHRPFNRAQPDAGGPTTPGNLVSYGHRDHQAKTDRLTRVDGEPGGALRTHWTERRVTHSEPHRYADPEPTVPIDPNPPPPDLDPDEPPF